MRKFNSKRSDNLTGIGGEYLSEPGHQFRETPKIKEKILPNQK